MTSVTAVIFTVLAIVTLIASLAAASGLAVTTISRDGQMFVSFEWRAGLTADVRDAIRSGLPTTFAYRIDVSRGTAAWFSRRISTMTVSSSVHYDNLTRRYQLSRTVDGRLADSRQTEDSDAMERWLTRFDQVPVLLTSALEANGEYDVRVRVQKTPRNNWFLLPWDRSTMLGDAKFTFLP